MALRPNSTSFKHPMNPSDTPAFSNASNFRSVRKLNNGVSFDIFGVKIGRDLLNNKKQGEEVHTMHGILRPLHLHF